jgi:hypothetical protein
MVHINLEIIPRLLYHLFTKDSSELSLVLSYLIQYLETPYYNAMC